MLRVMHCKKYILYDVKQYKKHNASVVFKVFIIKLFLSFIQDVFCYTLLLKPVSHCPTDQRMEGRVENRMKNRGSGRTCVGGKNDNWRWAVVCYVRLGSDDRG